MSIVVNGETLCLEGIITFCIQNALKLTYEHMRFQRFFRGLYPRTPVSRGASSNSAGKGAYNAGRGEGRGEKEGRERRGKGEQRGGECNGATAPPIFELCTRPCHPSGSFLSTHVA